MLRGVYFLANDEVLDLTVAFLNSFRKYNENLPLCFIPFNDNCQTILSLKEIYNFQLFDRPDLLKECDEISTKFHPRINGTYRKVAMWDGIFDEFIYIDVDTIVLQNVEFAFEYFDKYDCYTSHSNMPQIRRFVWKESIYKTNALSSEQIQFAANTGFIVSRKGVMSMEWVKGNVDVAVSIKEHMELYCQEQPFLNYLIVTSGMRYSSLFVIYSQIKDKRIMLEFWAGRRGALFKNGKFVSHKRYFLVHWAGCWQPRWFDFVLYRFLKYLGIADKTAKPKLYFFMPYKRLWRFYRFMNENQKLVPPLSNLTPAKCDA